MIVREERLIEGKSALVDVYLSDSAPISKAERLQALKLDKYLQEKIRSISKEMKDKGLLDLRGKKGVLRLWYEVGKRLAFVDDPRIVPTADRKYVWQAIFDHATREGLAPGIQGSREQQRPHFRYCYELAKKFPDYEIVSNTGDWSAWVEFLDSPTISGDPRIVEWLMSKKTEEAGRDWLRALTKEIRQKLPYKGSKTDTSVFSDGDLQKLLNSIVPE